jgi:hypothetical protein
VSDKLSGIWIDEEMDPDSKNEKTLPAIVRGKLRAALPTEEIEDELFSALLAKQRIFVFVDRLSEHSATTQSYVETIYRSARIGILALTSRTPNTIDGARSSIFILSPSIPRPSTV